MRYFSLHAYDNACLSRFTILNTFVQKKKKENVSEKLFRSYLFQESHGDSDEYCFGRAPRKRLPLPHITKVPDHTPYHQPVREHLCCYELVRSFVHYTLTNMFPMCKITCLYVVFKPFLKLQTGIENFSAKILQITAYAQQKMQHSLQMQFKQPNDTTFSCISS